MNMDEQQTSSPPEHGSPSSVHRPKAYERPQLIEWGTLNELTKGPLSGLQDVPEGGTEAQ